MSSILKLTLLLATVACLAVAQMNESGQQCLCQHLRNRIPPKHPVKDIQIYPATIFCDKVEIIVTSNNGYRFCLNPEIKAVRRVLATVISRRKQSTSTTDKATPVSTTSNSSNFNTARI